MARKNVFVKVSGDLFDRNDILDWIAKLAQKFFVVICVGGSSQINQAFTKTNIPLGEFGPLGREISDFSARQLARDVLEENQMALQEKLAERGIEAEVVIPVLDIGTVLCHVNGDTFALCAYLGFDVSYVLTTEDRFKEKQEKFGQYPKIEVVGFPIS